MKHKKIQKKFLLYIDGDLSEAEKLLIDQHLDECGDCKRHFEALADIWTEEKTLEQPLPSPALWYNLKDRMGKESLNKLPAATSIDNFKLILNTATTFVIILFAVLVGLKFGSILSTQNSDQNNSYASSENTTDEFGMSYFEAVPPNSIAKNILFTPSNDEGMKK